MCKTCNNTGGIATEYSWGLQMDPCPNTDCKVNEIERAKLSKHIEDMLITLKNREEVSHVK